MTDAPYELDFLQTVTNINFGNGPWLTLGVLSTGSDVSLEVDFISEAGGTPGLLLPVTAFGVRPAGFPPAPYTILAKDLVSKQTLAGLALTYFGVAGLFISPSFVTTLAYVIDTSKFNNVFDVRFSFGGKSIDVEASWITKNLVKAGASTLKFTPPNGGTNSQFTTAMGHPLLGPPIPVVTFRFNKQLQTVTLL